MDWRLPNRRELESIVDLGTFAPSVSSAFNNHCTAACDQLTCSCTAALGYWSSSSVASNPNYAWVVNFGDGIVHVGAKSSGDVVLYARAVRGP